MSMGSIVFLAIVALGYATFIGAVMGVYLYVNWPDRTGRRTAPAPEARTQSA